MFDSLLIQQYTIYKIYHLLATCAIRRQRVQLTAMGLIAPSFFSAAVREAPKKMGHIPAGMLAVSTWLVKAVTDCNSKTPPAPADAPTMSWRCCGLPQVGQNQGGDLDASISRRQWWLHCYWRRNPLSLSGVQPP